MVTFPLVVNSWLWAFFELRLGIRIKQHFVLKGLNKHDSFKSGFDEIEKSS